MVELTRYSLAVNFHDEESAVDRITIHDCSLSESCLAQAFRFPVAPYDYGKGHFRAHDQNSIALAVDHIQPCLSFQFLLAWR